MAGNSIGREFIVTTFGESHGKVVGVLIDGCPAGLALKETDFQEELDQRIPNNPNIVSPRIEKDTVQIWSGVFNGKTTGAPLTLTVENKETRSSDYETAKTLPRLAHSDYPAHIRYGGFNDYRGGGRFSGRITTATIIAGVVAKKLLAHQNIEVLAYTQAIGTVNSQKEFTPTIIRENRKTTATRCPDRADDAKMEAAILSAKEEGDSIGGVIECLTLNMPAGIGEPLFDTLDGDLAKALFSIPAVKGVEFGAGFRAAQLRGSENNDAMRIKDDQVITTTQNAGGIMGGLSNGMPIILRVAIKPTPSITKEQQTVDLATMTNAQLCIKGRHDYCIVPKAVPVVEATVAITLIDHLIRAGKIPKTLRRPNNESN